VYIPVPSYYMQYEWRIAVVLVMIMFTPFNSRLDPPAPLSLCHSGETSLCTFLYSISENINTQFIIYIPNCTVKSIIFLDLYIFFVMNFKQQL